jgi:hypothetical protein
LPYVADGPTRGSLRTWETAAVLELPDVLLLLGIHADHRIASGQEPGCGVMDVPELCVPVGMLAAFQRLGVRLQAVASLMQQPLH